LHVVAARARLVDELDGAVPAGKAAGELADRGRRVLDRGDVPHLAETPYIGDCDRDGFLVHVEADEGADLLHDTPSWLAGPTPGRLTGCYPAAQKGHVTWTCCGSS
jgi:hypothetical protein